MDNKILLESIYALFTSDWTEHLKTLNNKGILVINSREEDLMFRRQAQIIRLNLAHEKSEFFEGSHEYFALAPSEKMVKKIVRYLSR